jgi:hypothetical protein
MEQHTMVTFSLPQTPSPESIESEGDAFGRMILMITSPAEREAITDYGRCLLAGFPPPTRTTVHMFAALHSLSNRLPGYLRFVSGISTDSAALSRFEDRIALYVAQHEVQ